MTKRDELEIVVTEELDWWEAKKSTSTSVFIRTESETVKKHLTGILRMFSTSLFDFSKGLYDTVVFSMNPENRICTLTFKKLDENNILEVVSQKKIPNCGLAEGELVKVNGIIFWSHQGGNEIIGRVTIGEEFFVFGRKTSLDIPWYSDKEQFRWWVCKPEEG